MSGTEPDLGGEGPGRRDWLAAFSRPDTEWTYERFEKKVAVSLKPLTSTFRSQPFEDPEGVTWCLLFELKVQSSDKKTLGVFLEFKSASGARHARREFSFTLDSWPEDLKAEPDGTAIDRKPPQSFSATYSFDAASSTWGCPQFLPLSVLDAVVPGHEAVFTVRMALLPPDAPDPSYSSKRWTGCVGLLNQGATCYMNSLLQSLFHTRVLRRAVLQMASPQELLPENMVLALQLLFLELQVGTSYVSTKSLTRSFGWNSLDAFQQQDVQELNRVLCDRLEERMRGSSADGLTKRLFRGELRQFVRCLHVDYVSERTDEFYDLQLDVQGCDTVFDSFRRYTEPERLDGDNKYDAGEEHGKQDAEKGVVFQSLPPVLHLHLKRFTYNMWTDSMVKVNDRQEFPVDMDLTEFVSPPRSAGGGGGDGDKGHGTGEDTGKDEGGDCDSLPPTLYGPDEDLPLEAYAAAPPYAYTLHSVLVHSGSLHGGHYYTFVRPSSNPRSKRWLLMDDELVVPVSEEEAVQKNWGGAASVTSAYMLVYIRVRDLPWVMKSVPDTAIPPSLTARAATERAYQKRLSKLRRRAATRVVVRAVGPQHLAGASFCECRNDFAAWDEGARLSVDGDTTFRELAAMLAGPLGVPAEDQQMWRCGWRRNFQALRPLEAVTLDVEQAALTTLRARVRQAKREKEEKTAAAEAVDEGGVGVTPGADVGGEGGLVEADGPGTGVEEEDDEEAATDGGGSGADGVREGGNEDGDEGDDSSVQDSPLTEEERVYRAYEQQWSQPVSTARETELYVFVRPMSTARRGELLDSLLQLNENVASELEPYRAELEEHEQRLKEWKLRRDVELRKRAQAGAFAAGRVRPSIGAKEPRPQYAHAATASECRPLAGYDDDDNVEEEEEDHEARGTAPAVADPVGAGGDTGGTGDRSPGRHSGGDSTVAAGGRESTGESSDEEWTGPGIQPSAHQGSEDGDEDEGENEDEEGGGGVGGVDEELEGGDAESEDIDPFEEEGGAGGGWNNLSGVGVGMDVGVGQSETEVVPTDGSGVSVGGGQLGQGGDGYADGLRKRNRNPDQQDQPRAGASPTAVYLANEAEEPEPKRTRRGGRGDGDGGTGSNVSDSTDSVAPPRRSRWDGEAEGGRGWDTGVGGVPGVRLGAQANAATVHHAGVGLQSSVGVVRDAPSSPEPSLSSAASQRRKAVDLVFGNGGWQALPVGALMIAVKEYDGSASVEEEEACSNKAGELRRRVKALGAAQVTRLCTLRQLLGEVGARQPAPKERITVWETLDLSRTGTTMMPEHTNSLDKTMEDLQLASGDVLWVQLQSEEEDAPASSSSRSASTSAPEAGTDSGVRIEEVEEEEDGRVGEGAAGVNKGGAAPGAPAEGERANGEPAVSNGSAPATEADASSIATLFKGATPRLYARPRGERGLEVERAGLAPLYPAARVRFAKWLPLFRRAHTVREAHTHVRERVFVRCKPAAVPDGPGVVVEMSTTMSMEQAQEAVASALGVRSGEHVALYLRAEASVNDRIGQRQNMGRTSEKYSPFGCRFNWFLPTARPVNLVVARHGGRRSLLAEEPAGDPLPSLYYEVRPRVPRSAGEGGSDAEVLMPLRARLDPKLWLRLWKERAGRIEEERRKRKQAEEEEEGGGEGDGEGGAKAKAKAKGSGEEEEEEEEEEGDGAESGRPLVEALAERSDAEILDELVKEREKKEGERRLRGGTGSLEVWRDEAKARALAEDEEARVHDEEVARVQEEFHEELDAELGFRLLVPCRAGSEEGQGSEGVQQGDVVSGRAVRDALQRISAATGCQALQQQMRLLQQVGWWVKSVVQLQAAEFKFALRHLQTPEQEVKILEPGWAWDTQRSREFKSLASKQLPTGAAATLRLVQFCHAERRGSRRPRLFGPTQLLLVHSHVSLQEALQEARRRMGFEGEEAGSMPEWQPCAATEQREAQRVELVPLEPRSGLTVYAAQALLARKRGAAAASGADGESGQASAAAAPGVEGSPSASPPPPHSTQAGPRGSGSKASSEAEAEQLLAGLTKVGDEDLRDLTTGESWFDHLPSDNPESSATPSEAGTPAVLVLHHTNLLARGRRRPPRGSSSGPQGVRIR